MTSPNSYLLTNAAIPPEVASENAPTYTLTHKIYIENFATDVYIAGNSDTGSRTVSNLAITVTKPGSLIFDYALETRSGYAQYLLGYRLDTPIITDNSVDNTNVTPTIAGGIVGAWESCTISITQDDIGDDGTLTIYIAYLRNGMQVCLHYLLVTMLSF